MLLRSAVVIRPALPEDAHDIAEVHVASWRTTYTGIFPDALLTSLNVERRTAAWQEILQDPAQVALIAVASDGRIAGFVGGGKEKDGQSELRWRTLCHLSPSGGAATRTGNPACPAICAGTASPPDDFNGGVGTGRKSCPAVLRSTGSAHHRPAHRGTGRKKVSRNRIRLGVSDRPLSHRLPICARI